VCFIQDEAGVEVVSVVSGVKEMQGSVFLCSLLGWVCVTGNDK
jgi:hypothetical protein